ncbi:MAG: metal-transporting ATPase, partial [Lachnospiraceae bacterium]|nr:metal-transporting ATPase [Lachnospiraceae bacterium]
KCQATRVGEDTTLAQIIQMVSDASATKAPVARLADTISGYFVPAVIGISLLTLLIWLLLGRPAGFALARAICVLVVSCPCALGLATPVAIMVGNGGGARNGILFKTAEALQECGNTQIVCLDKTGTITSGQPKVTDVLPESGISEENLLQIAAALESRSEHPLARAVMDYTNGLSIAPAEVKEFTALPGTGLKGTIGLDVCYAGSRSFIGTLADLSAEAEAKCEKLAEEGKTPLLFAVQRYERPSFPQMRMTGAVTLGEQEIDQPSVSTAAGNARAQLLGIIAVADTIREDSAQAIRELRAQGIRVVMLTGDNQKTAEAIGKQAGVDEVIAGVLPEGKEEAVRQLKEAGKTAMVGDGINDAPALSRADTGIAIGAGTDVAIDTADVVLMKSRLLDASAAVRLSRATYRNILENLFWALLYNTLLIPLAAGAGARFGLVMNPMLGALAMSLSSFCVVSNALRLNLFKLYDGSKDKPKKNAISAAVLKPAEKAEEKAEEKPETKPKEPDQQEPAAEKAPETMTEKGETVMTKTMKIEGMMCEHCEATVKKALEALPFVESAQVSHVAGNAVVNLNGEADEAAMKAAVEAKDYKVLGIE